MAEEERNGYLLLEIACALDARSMRATHGVRTQGTGRHGDKKAWEGMGTEGMA
jgi:hypothetical protein